MPNYRLNSKNLVQSCLRQSREGSSENHFLTLGASVSPWSGFLQRFSPCLWHFLKKAWGSTPLCCWLYVYLGREKSCSLLFPMEWVLGIIITLPFKTSMNSIRLIRQAFKFSCVHSPCIFVITFIFSTLASSMSKISSSLSHCICVCFSIPC